MAHRLYATGTPLENARGAYQGRVVVFDAVAARAVVDEVVEDHDDSVADHIAIARALEYAREHCLAEPVVVTASQRCYFQITDLWPIRHAHAEPIVERSRGLLRELPARLSWTPPDENLARRYLVASVATTTRRSNRTKH